MGKVVYNGCFGGFGLSHEAIMLYGELKGLNLKAVKNDKFEMSTSYYLGGIEDNDHYFSYHDLERDDPILVEVVERLGKKVNDDFAELHIEDVPAGELYRIDEYDGRECVMLQSDYNWKVAK